MDTLLNEDRIKIRVQSWALLLSIVLLLAKFSAYFITRSVGIFTDATESIVNVVAACLSLYSLRIAIRPKDKDHPFGHGKIEFLSASIEGLLILLAGVWIIYEAIHRLLNPSPVQKLDIGIWIVVFAGLLNYAMGYYSVYQGKKYQSMALIAGGKHLQSDTYSSIGLALGLILLYVTDIPWIDGALALLFGAIIMITGVQILRKTIDNLLDKADTKLISDMASCINDHRQSDWIDIHNMKVIKYGSHLYIDCDLTVPWFFTINEGHQACDSLRDMLVAKFSQRIQLSIHSDPCECKHCEHCEISHCESRLLDFIALEEFSIQSLMESDEDRSNHGCIENDQDKTPVL